MENETNADKAFDVAKCRAKIIAGASHLVVSDLVDCLAPEQGHLCGCSLRFGNGYFCKHPRRNEFVEITEKLQSKLVSPPNISQSDNQE